LDTAVLISKRYIGLCTRAFNNSFKPGNQCFYRPLRPGVSWKVRSETWSRRAYSIACVGPFPTSGSTSRSDAVNTPVPLQVEWGKPVDPGDVDAQLATGQFDAITLIHNETSTGLVNPLTQISDVVRNYPEVIFIVDTVSSFSALPIPMDELAIDLMLTGSQKALALPPGLSLFSASQRAFERASQISDRGYYFDLLEFKKNAEEFMTPSTPTIPHIYALRSKLEEIFTEGLEHRYRRHVETNRLVHEWVNANGFEFFLTGRLSVCYFDVRQE